MKKIIYTMLILSLLCLVFAGCGKKEKEEKMTYTQITQEEAKKIMDSEEDYIILDVRESDEFAAGHIPGAIQLSYTQIGEKAADMLPDKDQLILVYCRSGNRSKMGAQALVNCGYTNVKEFGGIITWPYDITQN